MEMQFLQSQVAGCCNVCAKSEWIRFASCSRRERTGGSLERSSRRNGGNVVWGRKALGEWNLPCKSFSTNLNSRVTRFQRHVLFPRGVVSKEAGEDYSDKEKHRRKSTSGFPKGRDWGGIEDDLPQVTDSAALADDRPVVESAGERFLRKALESREAKIPRDTKGSGLTFAAKKRNVKEVTNVIVNKKKEVSPSSTKTKKAVPPVNTLNHNLPACYGCGAVLQTSEPEAPGFLPLQTFELKKKHHQLKTVLCGRCRLLSQGRMIPAVGGVGGYGNGKGFVLAEELRAQLSHLRYQKALIVKLVDIVDFNGSFLTRVRDLVGPNPIILVLTKIDLLPEGTDMAAVSDWLQEATLRKKLNVISIHLTSAKAKTGISRVAADIQRQRLGRDVYILGSANVGKSAFVTALLQDMARRDPVAAAALRFKPIQSAMPGTTLGAIEFDAFSGGGKLFDTPGVHLYHRMAAVVDSQDVSLLAPRRRLRGYVVGPPGLVEEIEEPEEESLMFEEGFIETFLKEKSVGDKWGGEHPVTGFEEEWETEEGSLQESILSGTSLFWGGVVRVDVVKAPANLKLTFFGPSAIRIKRAPTEEADIFYEENLGKTLTPPTASTVSSWSGLEKVQDIIFDLEKNSRHPAGDIAISGLGWITIGTANKLDEEEDGMGISAEDDEVSGKEDLGEDELLADAIELVLHTPKAVEVFVRPSIPLGKSAKDWYEYPELADSELEARATVYY